MPSDDPLPDVMPPRQDGASYRADMDERLRAGRLVDVWDDTVDVRDLCISLVICVTTGLGAFALATLILSPMVSSSQLAHAYSMLFGIVGSVLGGALCSALFAPKRMVVREAANANSPFQVIDDMARDRRNSFDPDDLPPDTAAELRTAGLYSLFEQPHTGRSDAKQEETGR